MGLLTIIRKQKLKDREKRVLILGLDNAGKSTVVRRVLGKSSEHLAPTMGFEISSVEHNGTNVNFWDVGGQQTLRAFWFNYFDQLDALVWVVDVAQLERLSEVFRELDKVLRNERVNGVKLLLLLNKVDLVEDSVVEATQRKVVTDLELDAYGAEGEKWKILPCSAVTGRNIDVGMDWLTRSDY